MWDCLFSPLPGPLWQAWFYSSARYFGPGIYPRHHLYTLTSVHFLQYHSVHMLVMEMRQLSDFLETFLGNFRTICLHFESFQIFWLNGWCPRFLNSAQNRKLLESYSGCDLEKISSSWDRETENQQNFHDIKTSFQDKFWYWYW